MKTREDIEERLKERLTRIEGGNNLLFVGQTDSLKWSLEPSQKQIDCDCNIGVDPGGERIDFIYKSDGHGKAIFLFKYCPDCGLELGGENDIP